MTVELRPLRRSDLPLLGRWLSAPHVERWWREAYDPDALESRYGPSIDGTDPTELLLVVRDGEDVGFVQRYLVDDNPGWRRALEPVGAPEPAVGVDYLIGEVDLIGRGLGPVVIEQLVRGTWTRYPRARSVVADVAQENRRSWRALEKSGFERAWAGTLDSDDPSDEGPVFVYVRRRD